MYANKDEKFVTQFCDMFLEVSGVSTWLADLPVERRQGQSRTEVPVYI